MGKGKMWQRRVTRRSFIKTLCAAGIASASTGLIPRLSRAAKRDYILIGHPTPATGPIAPFGETSTWVDERITKEINNRGGIYLKELGKRLPIRIKSMDTESNPTKAAQVASKLILQDKVDLMVVAHTPDTVNPVGATCERYEVPCISSVAPIEPWLTGGPYEWTFHFFWSLGDIITVFTGMWHEFEDSTNKVVGGFWPNDPDGTVWAKEFTKKLNEMGYKVVDVGRFPYGMQDFSSFISTWKREKVEILTGVPIPPDSPPSGRPSSFLRPWRPSAVTCPWASLRRYGGHHCTPSSHPSRVTVQRISLMLGAKRLADNGRNPWALTMEPMR